MSSILLILRSILDREEMIYMANLAGMQNQAVTIGTVLIDEDYRVQLHH